MHYFPTKSYCVIQQLYHWLIETIASIAKHLPTFVSLINKLKIVNQLTSDMKRSLLFKFIITAINIGIWVNADARIWRVSNVVGVSADFTQLTAAFNSPLVMPGDTIHLEGSPQTYNSAETKKKLVVIGPGYFLDPADGGNADLQYHKQRAYVSITLDSLASGSVIMGISGSIYLQAGADDITITRNNVSLYKGNGGVTASNIKITKNYISMSGEFIFDNLECTNNIIHNSCNVSSTSNTNVLFRNNVVTNAQARITNGYVSNNIFGATIAFVNCTVKHNIAAGANTLPTDNNNQNGRQFAQLFLNSGSDDGKYRLAAGSPAIGAGEPINGVTPDCGAFGTDDPYRLSGIAPVPTIYSLSVPASVPTTATSMTVTISTRSNN